MLIFSGDQGGAAEGSSVGAIFHGCLFSDNSAAGHGGAIDAASIYLPPIELSDCTFEGNQASAGGAVRISRATLDRCVFQNNVALAGDGGALRMSPGNYGSSEARNCSFIGNSASGRAGGAYAHNSTLTNLLFLANHAGSDGGGLMVEGDSTIVNATLSGNTAPNAGGLFSGPGVGYFDVQVANSIIWGNSAPEIGEVGPLAITYSNVGGGWLGDGNIDEDPLLHGPEGRLSALSPCIDAGDNTAVPDGVESDLDGNPRYVDDPETPDGGNNPDALLSQVDMGAYEFCRADTNRDGTVDVQDLVIVILAWGTNDAGADTNGDGVVDVSDLIAVVLNWGPCS